MRILADRCLSEHSIRLRPFSQHSSRICGLIWRSGPDTIASLNAPCASAQTTELAESTVRIHKGTLA